MSGVHVSVTKDLVQHLFYNLEVVLLPRRSRVAPLLLPCGWEHRENITVTPILWRVSLMKIKAITQVSESTPLTFSSWIHTLPAATSTAPTCFYKLILAKEGASSTELNTGLLPSALDAAGGLSVYSNWLALGWWGVSWLTLINMRAPWSRSHHGNNLSPNIYSLNVFITLIFTEHFDPNLQGSEKYLANRKE